MNERTSTDLFMVLRFCPLSTHSNPSLEFVAAPALAPPEVQVDAALMEDYQRQLDAAAAAPLPDEEDNDI